MLILAKYFGWIMLVIGILAYFITVIQFSRNFLKGILITNGIFALSRNPLYGSWIVFILPSIAFISGN
jgi:protein-S-isoprenylcysteine O-methyltransferase Ste14